MSESELSPTRPYMVRAIYEWLEDNYLTPYLMVDTTVEHVQVPTEYIQDGRIVLNIASRATGNMNMDNDFISFSARFGGVSRDLWVPMQAVMGIYAKENSQGMFFDPSEYENYQPATSDDTQTKAKPKRENKAGLKVLK
ncbi:ClpXP protease specificity-enhancing factor [Psychrobacter sp. I-STPA6b]|uniref:ClpXP protease specificity-enhancing factor n=1 Tax=Psychrobacter sp. I-STPA6b TaxID=2585718 RepID=UPI001D0BFEB9|nr:ClpXP protease specificity-enhancing factor [Psychrobacter sp. I-STPA6b]